MAESFKKDQYNYANSTNIHKKTANTMKDDVLTKDERLRLQMKKWTSFYRLNVHRFVEDYFGYGDGAIKLFLFQKILLFFMNLSPLTMTIAARGISKSYVTALYCCCRAILYPNSKIIIASGTKGQAKLIITEKIEKELMQCKNLAREIKVIKTSANEAKVIFMNGSTIDAVTSTENSRGYRGNVLVVEECRMVSKEILETVLLPFLNVYRQPPFLKKPEYAHLKEENVELYISSAYYKSHHMYQQMLSSKDMMLRGENVYFFALDYLLAIHHGLLSEERINREKRKKDFDEIALIISAVCW